MIRMREFVNLGRSRFGHDIDLSALDDAWYAGLVRRAAGVAEVACRAWYEHAMSLFDLFSPRARIVRQVRKRYGTQADAVMRELDRYAGSRAAERDRVHRAILKLTDGSFENLKRWVEVARYDHRDVLGPAEYPDASTAGNVRDFNAWKLDPATVAETSFAGLEGDPEPSGERNA